MKDFEALRSIWGAQSCQPKVSHDDVLKKVGSTKTGLASRLMIEMFGMGAAMAVLAYVWVSSPFKMWTTHLAMVIFLACCAYYIVALLDSYRQITSDNLMNKPGEYILYLKNYRQKRFIFNTRKYRIYSLFFTAGFILYFIEIAFLASLWVTVTGIVFTVLWIWFCYFVLMRIYIRREESKLGEMITNLERLERQFEDSEEG